MAYIQKIVNDINEKVYIGKTEGSIEKRFKEHCWESTKETEQHRPLYSAMKKYGIEHFHIELIEETQMPSEREKFWIAYFNSYHYGYNATMGGEGTRQADYDLIYNLWEKGLTSKQICEQVGCCSDTVNCALNNFNVSEKERRERSHKTISKPVAMLDKDTEEILQIFSSVEAAKIYLKKEGTGASSHISDACKGKRKSAYGQKWKFFKE